jgi:copper chaperone
VKAVKNAVGALSGVANVAVDLNAKTVTVDYDPTQSALDKIKFEIEEQGYDVVT